MKSIILILLLCIPVLPLLSFSDENFTLSSFDHEMLKKGEPVLRKKKIEGAPWPEITVFSTIKTTPAESMGVFYAYHEHKDFLPDLLLSTPSRYISPSDLHIKFEMKIPWPLKNSRYTTGNKLSKYGNGGYRIDWYHVTSTSSKTTRGLVIFIPYKNKTLFIYRTFVHPKSKLAGMFKKKMTKEVLRSVRAIVGRIESIKKNKQERIPFYIDALERSLRGEFIYKNIPGAVKDNGVDSN